MQSPDTLTNEELAEILNNADVIENWVKSVREYASQLLEAGEYVPGWTLAPKRGVRKWVDERLVRQRLASEGLEGFISESLATPAQVERLAKKQKVQVDLFDLITSESSGTKLVRETNSAAAAAASAVHDFAD